MVQKKYTILEKERTPEGQKQFSENNVVSDVSDANVSNKQDKKCI